MADTSFDLDVIRSFSQRSLAECKELAFEMLNRAFYNNMKKSKIAMLKHQINSVKDVLGLEKIMWNAYLSGENMAVVGSNYQRRCA